MRADDGDHIRAALIARKDAALKQWPERSGDGYEAEMAAIARELDALARSLDGADSDPVSRLRTWSAAGEAYLLTGAKYALQCATEAFRCAETAAALAEANMHDLVKLQHQYGLALLKLAEDKNAELTAEAATRLSTALSLARKHMPVGVAAIKFELIRAEHTLTALRAAQGWRPVATDWRESELV
jgi:hypothetical protein